jgi:capsular polysaccharide biosynthesis protein
LNVDLTTHLFTHPNGGFCHLTCSPRHVKLLAKFEAYFARSWRPEPPPQVLTLENVILADQADGACLYDAEGKRIDASALSRLDQDFKAEFFRASPLIENLNISEKIEEPVVFQSIFFFHWGHFLTESIARLWALDLVVEAMGRQSVFTYASLPETVEGPYADFLSAAGVRLLRRGAGVGEARLATCLVPTPSFEINGFADPLHLRGPHRVARRLLKINRRDSRPVYLSRSLTNGEASVKRWIENEPEFEARLAARGVRIAHMERLSLAEQVEIVNTHTVFIGPWGSALHNILFSLSGREMTSIVLISGGFPRVFLLLDSIVGNCAHYLDVMRPVEVAAGMIQLRLDIDRSMAYLGACGIV